MDMRYYYTKAISINIVLILLRVVFVLLTIVWRQIGKGAWLYILYVIYKYILYIIFILRLKISSISKE